MVCFPAERGPSGHKVMDVVNNNRWTVALNYPQLVIRGPKCAREIFIIWICPHKDSQTNMHISVWESYTQSGAGSHYAGNRKQFWAKLRDPQQFTHSCTDTLTYLKIFHLPPASDAYNIWNTLLNMWWNANNSLLYFALCICTFFLQSVKGQSLWAFSRVLLIFLFFIWWSCSLS